MEDGERRRQLKFKPDGGQGRPFVVAVGSHFEAPTHGCLTIAVGFEGAKVRRRVACEEWIGHGFAMSLHRSLRSGGATAAKRNVLKRFERVTLLKKRGQWKAGMKSTGLPKTKPD